MTVFHGGCIGCSMQKTKGLEYCTGCQYFECNWGFPDLNDEHKRQREKLEKVREKARYKKTRK